MSILTTLIVATICTATPNKPELCAGGLPKGVTTEIVAPAAGCSTSSWSGNANGAWTIPSNECRRIITVRWKRTDTGDIISTRQVDLTHQANEATSVTVKTAL